MSAGRRRRAPVVRTSYGVAPVALIIVGLPMALGGAFPITVPIACTVALIALACTGVDVATIRRDRLVQAGLLLVAVTLFQLVPLPSWLIGWIDGESAEFSSRALAAFDGEGGARWRALHMDPGNGYAILQQLIGLLAMYVAARQLTARGHGKAILDASAYSILWIAILGLAHRTIGLETVYGLSTRSVRRRRPSSRRSRTRITLRHSAERARSSGPGARSRRSFRPKES
jgi:hypothetical protein